MRLLFGLFLFYGFINTLLSTLYYYEPLETLAGFFIGSYMVQKIFDKNSTELIVYRKKIGKWIYKYFFLK